MNRAFLTSVVTLLLVLAPLSRAGEPSPPDAQFTLAIAGDMIGPFHPMNRLSDPRFAKIADLFRSANAGFANQEGAIFDLARFAGYPAAESGGGYPVQQSSTAIEMRDMGITLVSKANNHATDYGTEGLVASLDNLHRAGIVPGGAGLSEKAARQPVYLHTRDGSIALVATASTFPPSSVAGGAVVRQKVQSNARPGISALHVRQVRILPPKLFAALREAAGPLATDEGSALRISDQVFREGTTLGTVWEMDPADEGAILGAVHQAKAHANLVLFSIHAHETAGYDFQPPPLPFEPMVLRRADEAPSPNDPRPASFEVTLFHAAVDHGADVVIRHGPHVIGGIEIYKGKPIFYGIGSLFLDFGGRRVLDTPGGEKLIVPDSWYEGIVAVCAFQSHRLRKIAIYPIVMDPEAGARSGMPALAEGSRARVILERLRRLSAAFGTKVEITGNVGLIQGPAG